MTVTIHSVLSVYDEITSFSFYNDNDNEVKRHQKKDAVMTI